VGEFVALNMWLYWLVDTRLCQGLGLSTQKWERMTEFAQDFVDGFFAVGQDRRYDLRSVSDVEPAYQAPSLKWTPWVGVKKRGQGAVICVLAVFV
jgi:hypothetical protein